MDVEGVAYEVLETLGEAWDRVGLLHVETETRPHWEGQRLQGEVLELLEAKGFRVVARRSAHSQEDLVLLPADRAGTLGVRLCLLVGRLLDGLQELGVLEGLRRLLGRGARRS